MLLNKPLFNKIEENSTLYGAYETECLDCGFIKSLYMVVRQFRYEQKHYEKNYRFSAEKVIARNIKLLDWICKEQISNSTNDTYVIILKEKGVLRPWTTWLDDICGP